MQNADWTDAEIDLIVSDYFDMRSKFLAGEPFVKAVHNRKLQERVARSRGSIERKHMNISAVLEELCVPWLRGYAPGRNYQRALVAAVERRLAADPSALLQIPRTLNQLSEGAQLYIGQAPKLLPCTDEGETETTRIVRKFDPATRDMKNRKLGELGEQLVFDSEVQRLRAAGQEALSRKVRWVSKEDGDGAGYDILSFSNSGSERFLEVKTTLGHARTPFFISENERAFAAEEPERARVFRLYEYGLAPKAFVIKPPLEQKVDLKPTIYRASF